MKFGGQLRLQNVECWEKGTEDGLMPGLDVRPESIPDSAVVWWRSNEHQAETQGT